MLSQWFNLRVCRQSCDHTLHKCNHTKAIYRTHKLQHAHERTTCDLNIGSIWCQSVSIVLLSYQSATAAHGEGTLDQCNGLGDSSDHGGYHLGLLGHSDRTRLVYSDDGSGGSSGRGRSCCAHLGCSSLQHPGGRVADLQAQSDFNN